MVVVVWETNGIVFSSPPVYSCTWLATFRVLLLRNVCQSHSPFVVNATVADGCTDAFGEDDLWDMDGVATESVRNCECVCQFCVCVNA